jgi:hypothetical protein
MRSKELLDARVELNVEHDSVYESPHSLALPQQAMIDIQQRRNKFIVPAGWAKLGRLISAKLRSCRRR